jgi:hypothetical protein
MNVVVNAKKTTLSKDPTKAISPLRNVLEHSKLIQVSLHPVVNAQIRLH